MDVLYLLIPLSVVLVFLIGVVFWFALRSGQFDDLEGPAMRIVADNDAPTAEGPAGGESRAPPYGGTGSGRSSG
jgi:cbb3-type cytochrome oxidase maturation protein